MLCFLYPVWISKWPDSQTLNIQVPRFTLWTWEGGRESRCLYVHVRSFYKFTAQQFNTFYAEGLEISLSFRSTNNRPYAKPPKIPFSKALYEWHERNFAHKILVLVIRWTLQNIFWKLMYGILFLTYCMHSWSNIPSCVISFFTDHIF